MVFLEGLWGCRAHVGQERGQGVSDSGRGKAVEILLVGSVTFLAFLLLGLNYAVLLAVLETVLFLLFVPGTALLPPSWGWPMAGGLVAAAWLINGAVAGLDWHRNRPVKEEGVS